MSPLERRVRWLLRAYPDWYLRNRGDEMLGTVLDAAGPDREWPPARDAVLLVWHGLLARARSYWQLGLATNLRLAALLGVAIFIADGEGGLLSLIYVLARTHHAIDPNLDPLYPSLVALATLAVVVVVWFANRWIGTAAAVACALLTYPWQSDLLSSPYMTAALLLLAALALGRIRPPASWLWLTGLAAACGAVQWLLLLAGSPLYGHGGLPLASFMPWLVLVVALLWMPADVRPAVGAIVAINLATVISFYWRVTGNFPGFGLLAVPVLTAIAIPIVARMRARRRTGPPDAISPSNS
jgi:hypothetical protein